MRFNLSSPWWIETMARRYAHVQLSAFLGAEVYNGTACTPACCAQGPPCYSCTCGEFPLVELARRLKAVNPRFKVMLYQAADRGDLTPFGSRMIQAHPEWWLRDDHGNVVYMNEAWRCLPNGTVTPDAQCHPVLDWTNADVRAWFRNFPIQLFNGTQQAAALFDGLMVDAGGYYPEIPWFVGGGNISLQRYQQLFSAEMQMLHEAQVMYAQLNGGLVLDNGGLPNPGSQPTWPGLSWRNVAGAVGGGSFLEWFGSFGQLDDNGSWDVASMNATINTIRQAASAGYPVVLKAAPGPATTPFLRRGYGADQGLLEHNGYYITSWKGPAGPVPNASEACRAGAARFLVQSLAPFLIVVEPNVFWSYAWFYNMEDGYIPCPGTTIINNVSMDIECGMPTAWYPEFERPLGPPAGPPTCTNGTVWTRRFARADVYVDLANMTAARIDWW